MLSFLGFISFYKRFIKNYSKITAPLTDLIKNNRKGPIELGNYEVEAFKTLKQKFLEEPILKYFNPEAPIRVEINVLDFVISVVLSQS